ncbi:MAG: MATE family efflux transporter [Candidatus Woesearchaeota archaeon]
MRKSRDLVNGSIKDSIIQLAIPIFFANLLQVSYKLIDLFFVGRLGKEAIAAISVSFPILFLIVSLSIGFAMAGNILVSQYKGDQNSKKVNHTATQTFVVVLAASIIISILGFIYAPFILSFMELENQVLRYSIQYMRTYFLGLPFLFTYGISQGLMRGVGDVKTPLRIVLVTVLLNIILDPLLIFGIGPFPKLEVFGAAIATVFSQGVSAIVCISIFLSNKYQVKMNFKNYRPDFKILKKVFFLGIPSSLETTARAFATTVMVFIISNLGTVTTAAYGIGAKIFNVITIPAFALSIATTTIVGQNIGAGNKTKAKETMMKSIKYAVFLLSVLGIISFIFSTQLSQIFTNDIDVINQTSNFIKFLSVSFWILGIQVIINGALRGSGNTKNAMFITITSLWIIRIPIALIMINFLGMNQIGIWLSFPVSEIFALIFSLIVINKTNWLDKKTINKKDEKSIVKTNPIKSA